MNKISLLFLLAWLPMSAQENADQKYNLSLDEAIAYALEHNYSSINAGRDIEIARQKKRETTATGLPQINAAVDYVNNFVIQKSVIPAELIPGGTPGEFIAVEFSPKQTMNARSTLNQLLFDGSYIVALQASKTYLKYYENAKRKTDVEIREMVTSSYGNVLLSEESIEILRKNKSTLETTLHETTETFKQGLIEEENVEQLQITLASVNSNLNNALRMRDIAISMLKITLGMTLETDVTLTDDLEDLTQKHHELALSTSEFAIKESIDYQIAQNFEQQRTLELKLEKSKALPSLSANVNFGYNAFDDSFSFFKSNQQWFNYSNLGVNLNIPIFSSFGRSARTQQASIALEQAKTQLTETEQRLKLQYDSAKSEYAFSIEEYATAKNNLRLAERIERKQQIKFSEGLSSSFDFSEAQRQLYTAQQNFLQSMVNVINRKAELEKITTK